MQKCQARKAGMESWPAPQRTYIRTPGPLVPEYPRSSTIVPLTLPDLARTLTTENLESTRSGGSFNPPGAGIRVFIV